MTLKIGLVGAGRMTQMAHLPNLLQVGGVQPVAIAIRCQPGFMCACIRGTGWFCL